MCLAGCGADRAQPVKGNKSGGGPANEPPSVLGSEKAGPPRQSMVTLGASMPVVERRAQSPAPVLPTDAAH